MVYVDLLSDVPEDQKCGAPGRPGREVLSPRRSSRREQVIQQLLRPTVVAETADLLERQAVEVYSAFKPRNGWQDWLTSTVATLMIRINRSERVERKLRDWASYRAFDFWEDDQKLAVETVALRIDKEPAKVVAKLRETPSGIEWLIARWRTLAKVEPQGWTDDHRALAIRLLGGDSGADPVAPGFVARRIGDLEAVREQVKQADEIIRGLVEADLHDDGVPGLAKLRRYVRSLHRQLKWYVDQYHVEHPDRWDDPRRRPACEGPAREQWRPPNPDHFEGKPDSTSNQSKPAPRDIAPENDETNPLFEASALENGETNPFVAQSAHGNDETNPFEPVKPPTSASSSFAIEPPTFVHDYANERGRNQSRPLLAGEVSRESRRRQKAARRRTNLALAELI